MIPILLSLSALFVAALVLLGALRFLDAGFRQKAIQIEEELNKESAEILRRGEELDSALVEALIGAEDLAIVVPAWQKDRADVLTKIGEKPWDWGTQFLERWRDEQRTIRCGHLDEQLKKQKVVTSMVVLALSIACGFTAYATAAWSYFGSR